MNNPFKSLIPARRARTHADRTPAVTGTGRDDFYTQTGGWTGIPDHVPLYKLVRYFNRDPYFALSVRSLTDLVVGGGYRLTAADDSRQSVAALKIVEAFCTYNHFDEFLSRCVTDLWISGNTFFRRKAKDRHALKHVDQSNVVDIRTDHDGDPSEYIVFDRTTPIRGGFHAHDMRGRMSKVPAAEMWHWRFQAFESPFGSGLGQINARRGEGYTGPDGQRYYSKPAFESRELQKDVTDFLQAASVPRHVINMNGDEEAVDATVDAAKSNKLGQDIITSGTDTTIQTISRAPGSDMDAVFAQNKDSAMIYTSNPTARLWAADRPGSYASDETAAKSTYPLVDAMARAVKHHTQSLFRQILREVAPTIDAAAACPKIHLNADKIPDLERITMAVKAIKDAGLVHRIDPDSFYEALQDASVPFGRTENPQPAVPRTMEQRREEILDQLLEVGRRKGGGGGASGT